MNDHDKKFSPPTQLTIEDSIVKVEVLFSSRCADELFLHHHDGNPIFNFLLIFKMKRQQPVEARNNIADWFAEQLVWFTLRTPAAFSETWENNDGKEKINRDVCLYHFFFTSVGGGRVWRGLEFSKRHAVDPWPANMANPDSCDPSDIEYAI